MIRREASNVKNRMVKIVMVEFNVEKLICFILIPNLIMAYPVIPCTNTDGTTNK